MSSESLRGSVKPGRDRMDGNGRDYPGQDDTQERINRMDISTLLDTLDTLIDEREALKAELKEAEDEH